MTGSNSTNRVSRSRDELEFLPAALEIQETPPLPLARAITWLIILFFGAAVTWACIGEVDVVATARGKLVPGGRTKVIQPLEKGVVSAIHVREGQFVAAGDLLIELDPTEDQADLERIREDLRSSELDRLRLEALVDLIEGERRSTQLIPAVDADFSADSIMIQQQLLVSRWTEFQSSVSALRGELAERRARKAAAEQEIAKLRATVPLITERARGMKSLSEQKLASVHLYLELEQERIEQVQELKIQEERAREMDAAIQTIQERIEVLRSELTGKALEEMAQADRKAAALKQERIKAEQRARMRVLRAPVGGTIQQLAVHTIGGVVTPAQALMIVVPEENVLEVEAWIENKDIGFVHEAQTAEIKIETFPFTKYGVIDGEIIDISDDAVQDEQRGLVYAARVLMNQSVITVEDKLVRLTPGMAVTVEIKTGKRRLIEFFLSPLLRYKAESVRER